MKSITGLAIATALLLGASSVAMAQNSGSMNSGSSTTKNSTMSGGPGTHVGAPKTGTTSSNQKVLHNQNGYRGQQQ
jgi:hypothetical protein